MYTEIELRPRAETIVLGAWSFWSCTGRNKRETVD